MTMTTGTNTNEVESRYKFRGKDIYGEWHHGCVTRFGSQWRISTNDPDAIGDPDAIVRPETVGQCTGVKDQNGVDIYEGDILRFAQQRPYIVAWRYNGWYIHRGFCYNRIGDQVFEVVGNIHEQAELERLVKLGGRD